MTFERLHKKSRVSFRSSFGRECSWLLMTVSLGFFVSCKAQRTTLKNDPQGSQNNVKPQSSAAQEKSKKSDSSARGSEKVRVTDDDPSLNECDRKVALSLADYPVAEASLRVQFQFYGNSKSTALVINLPDYQHGPLSGILVVRLPSGRVLARRGIDSQVDIRENTTLRPIFFDNLSLKSDKRIAILFELDGGKAYEKFEMPEGESISFEDTFLGKPVFSFLAPHVTPLWIEHQVSPNVRAKGDGSQTLLFNFDRSSSQKIKYPSSKTQFYLSGTQGCYITDLMGDEILSRPGEEFDQVIEHPDVICYKEVGDGYVRTFLRNW